VFLYFFKPKYIIAQANELARQVRNPTKNEVFTPKFVNVIGVTKTFRIYPTSGNIKTTPAYFPIQEEAILP